MREYREDGLNTEKMGRRVISIVSKTINGKSKREKLTKNVNLKKCKRVKFATNVPQMILKLKIREITRSKNSKEIRDSGKYLKLIKII